MKPLISIETVPISIEYTSTKQQSKARGLPGSGYSAQLSVSKDSDRVTIKSEPIQIQLQDRFEQSSPRYMAYTATAEYSKSGTLSMNVRIQDGGGADAGSDYRFQAVGSGIDRMLDAVPRTQAQTQSQAPQTPSPLPFAGMRIDFDVAQLQANTQISSDLATSFIPPDLEIEVVEYPKVIIKYIGGPIYFPRSADPNYDPPAADPRDAHFEAKA
jgi:hypothetical protein